MVAAGLLVGLLGALLLASSFSGLVYGVTARDPLTLALVALLLLGISVAACLGPVRRAARVAPTVALRGAATALLGCVLLASAVSGAAAPALPPLLVDAAWLAPRLGDPRLVLLHVGPRAEYDAAHIAGARHVPFGGEDDPLTVSDHSGRGLMLEMPVAEALRRGLESLGISDDSLVVAYYGKDWVSPTTRVVFTLDHAGLESVSLLDGGMAAWKAAGHPVTSQAPVARRGSLRPLRLRPTVVDAAFVREHVGKPGFALVDARDASFYDGVDVGAGHAGPHQAGHISGAGSLPFQSVTTADLKLKPKAELAALFERAGVGAGDTVIGYCHIGQQVTAMLFAARILGHPVLLYDGSFEDWSLRKGAVERTR
jgi:thiosulfate/3-mercaptopyruvate sulfurtransferase